MLIKDLVIYSTVVPNRALTSIFTNAVIAKEPEETQAWIDKADEFLEKFLDDVFGPNPTMKKDDFISEVTQKGGMLLSSEKIRKQLTTEPPKATEEQPAQKAEAEQEQAEGGNAQAPDRKSVV